MMIQTSKVRKKVGHSGLVGYKKHNSEAIQINHSLTTAAIKHSGVPAYGYGRKAVRKATANRDELGE